MYPPLSYAPGSQLPYVVSKFDPQSPWYVVPKSPKSPKSSQDTHRLLMYLPRYAVLHAVPHAVPQPAPPGPNAMSHSGEPYAGAWGADAGEAGRGIVAGTGEAAAAALGGRPNNACQ